MTPDFALCREVTARHPYPLLFATVSGAHLYGFPSPDSDYDLRGVHVLPAREMLGLDEPRETITSEEVVRGVEVDFVTHDAAKFFRLLLRKNGYVREQLLSPLVVLTSPHHARLCELACECITRHHAHHYLGFAETQWKLFAKEERPRIKPLLYVYRVLLTGTHLMRTGVVVANLPALAREYEMAELDEIITRKVTGTENLELVAADVQRHAGEYERLRAWLEDEQTRSRLPETSTAQAALSEMLIELRLGGPPATRAPAP